MPLPDRSAALLVSAALCVAVTATVQAGPNATLVGDEHRGVVMRDVAAGERSEIRRRGGVYELSVESAGMMIRSLAVGEGGAALANLLHTSDIALIVVDAAKGPTPEVREHVIVARQARVPLLAVLVANVKRLYAGAPDEADELLALEIQEVRALLSAYELDGDSVAVYLDAEAPAVGIAAHSVRDALLSLARFVPRRVRSPEMEEVTDFWGAVYLLTGAEARGDAVGLSPDDPVTVWSEGAQSDATLSSITRYLPGDFREMPLSLETPIRASEGSRILLMRGERVVGLGAITQIGR